MRETAGRHEDDGAARRAAVRSAVRAVVIALAAAAVLTAGLHLLVRPGGEAVSLESESTRMRDELIRLSNDTDRKEAGGQVCGAWIAAAMYELRKDAVAADNARAAERAALARGETLTLALTALSLAAVLFGLWQLAAAGRAGEDAERDARLRAGQAALAAGVAGALGLALFLAFGSGGTGAATPRAEIDLTGLLELCEDHRVEE